MIHRGVDLCLKKLAEEYNLILFPEKTKLVKKYPVRTEIGKSGRIMEQVWSFNYLRYEMKYLPP